MERVIVNELGGTGRKTYVLMDDDNDKVVAVIQGEYDEDITDKVILAIKEDVIAETVTIDRVTGEVDYRLDVTILEEDYDEYEREYSLYLTAIY
jgi:alpha-galactosidase